MSAPILENTASELYSSLAPIASDDAENGYPLAVFCGALGMMFDPIDSWVRDDDNGPGWSVLLDIDRAPSEALAWLAQFVGVTLDPSLVDVAQRDRIRGTDGMRRGSPSALIAAAQQYLTGAKTVIVRERDPDEYTLTVVTYTAETPDSAAVIAALEAQKPAGLILNYVVESGQDWVTLAANYATWADVAAHFTTWQDVVDNTPH